MLGILSAISVVVLLALGAVPVTCTNAADDDDEGDTDLTPSIEGDVLSADDMAKILKVTDAVLLDRKLFTGPDITLFKVAGKAGLFARDISMAVNRQHSMNVS